MHRGYQPGVSASVAVLLSMLAGKPAQHTEGHKCWWPMHLKHPDSRRSSADLGHTVPHHTQQISMLAKEEVEVMQLCSYSKPTHAQT